MTIHSMLKVYHILASLPFVQANKFLFVGIREFLQVFFTARYYAERGICCRRVSVCLSVCVCVVSKTAKLLLFETFITLNSCIKFLNKKHLKNVGPIRLCEPFYIVIHQVSLLSHAGCASMSTTTTTTSTTTTTRD